MKNELILKAGLDEQSLIDIVIDAIEGSLSWAFLWSDEPAFEALKGKGIPLSERVWIVLINGGTVEFSDNELITCDWGHNAKVERWGLTLEKLIKGVEQNAFERSWDAILDNHDSVTCNCIIQYALFGKLVFND